MEVKLLNIKKIGFGGGCHWCTEAVFQFFKGVENVEQGWIKSAAPNESFSEAVIVNYDAEKLNLKTLIEAHLLTHASTVDHRFRKKYRSAIYYFTEEDKIHSEIILNKISAKNKLTYILKILPFVDFKSNRKKYLNYFQQNKEAPFCETYVVPKLKILEEKFKESEAWKKIII